MSIYYNRFDFNTAFLGMIDPDCFDILKIVKVIY